MRVLGTYRYSGCASQQLRALCETMPRTLFDHLSVALFGTQLADEGRTSGTSATRRCGMMRAAMTRITAVTAEIHTPNSSFSSANMTRQNSARARAILGTSFCQDSTR